MARQHADTAVISEGHKEVVNIRTAGAASKCSPANAIRIRIRPNSLKTTIRCTPSCMFANYCRNKHHINATRCGHTSCVLEYDPTVIQSRELLTNRSRTL